MRSLLSLAHCHGAILGTAWHMVLTTLQVSFLSKVNFSLKCPTGIKHTGIGKTGVNIEEPEGWGKGWRTKALPPLFLPLVVSYGFLVNKYIEITVVDQRGFIGVGEKKAGELKQPLSSFFHL